MDIRQIRHVVELARTLSFTKAAERLGITQSALSRSLRSLEELYGVRLFDRSSSSVHLTSVGRSFVREAEALLRDQTGLERLLQRSARGESGEIALGMSPLPARAFQAPLLVKLLEVPDCQVSVTVRDPAELFAMLLEEKIELCICASRNVGEKLPVTGTALGHFPLALLVRASHPLAGGDQLEPDRFDGFPVVMSSHVTLENAAAGVMTALLRRPPSIVTESYDVLKDVTLGTDAIWITSPISAVSEVKSGQLIDLLAAGRQPETDFELAVYSLQRRSRSPLANRAVDSLQALAHDVRQTVCDNA